MTGPSLGQEGSGDLAGPRTGFLPPQGTLGLPRLAGFDGSSNNSLPVVALFQGLFGEGNGTPLQYSCLENPMDAGAWKAAVHGAARSRTRRSDFTFTFTFQGLAPCSDLHACVDLSSDSEGVQGWSGEQASPQGLPGTTALASKGMGYQVE